MLLLDSALEIDGRTVFRDHADEQLFHFLPGEPAVAIRNGSPALEFIRFRGGTGGGVLAVEVELERTEAKLAALHATLTARFGEVNLVPVLFDSGTARLSILGTKSHDEPTSESARVLVENVLGASIPSLTGRNTALFSVSLTPEGAALVRSALDGETLPILVVYELSFTGLQRARGVRATVDLQMAYEQLTTRFGADTLVFRGEMDAAAETLQTIGAIRIEDVDFIGEDPAAATERSREVLQTLRELHETLFFTPAASPVTVASDLAAADSDVRTAWSASGQAAVTFRLRSMKQDEQRSLSYDFTADRAAVRTIAPQAALRTTPGMVVRSIDLESEPLETHVHVLAPPDADWTGVAALRIDVRTGDSVQSTVLRPEQSDATLVLPAGPIEYRVTVLRTADEQAAATTAPSDFRPLAQPALLIDPAAQSGHRRVRIVLGPVDHDRPITVEGRATTVMGTQVFQLSPAVSEATLVAGADEAIVLTLTHHEDGAVAVHDDRIIATGENLFVVHAAMPDRRPLWIELRDPLRRYARVFVEVEGPGDEWSVPLDASESSVRRTVPVGDVRYRVRTIGHDARIVESEWRAVTGSLLVVGDTELRIVRVTGFLVTDAPFDAVLLTLTPVGAPAGIPARRDVLLPAGETRFTVDLPFERDAETRFTVEGQIFAGERLLAIPPRIESGEVVLLDAALGS